MITPIIKFVLQTVDGGGYLGGLNLRGCLQGGMISAHLQLLIQITLKSIIIVIYHPI